jgi:mono/diheme cytochrome c family protein
MKKILALSFLVSALLAVAAKAAPAADNWDNNCAKCHSADGSGSGKMGKRLKLKDYTDATVQAALKDEDMFKAIKEGVKDENGKDRMKAFKDDLTDPEITDLVAFIRKLKK